MILAIYLVFVVLCLVLTLVAIKLDYGQVILGDLILIFVVAFVPLLNVLATVFAVAVLGTMLYASADMQKKVF